MKNELIKALCLLGKDSNRYFAANCFRLIFNIINGSDASIEEAKELLKQK